MPGETLFEFARSLGVETSFTLNRELIVRFREHGDLIAFIDLARLAGFDCRQVNVAGRYFYAQEVTI